MNLMPARADCQTVCP